MATASYLWLVFTNAAPGTDAEFNRWYDEVHLPDLLRVPGIIAASRHRPAAFQMVATDGALTVQREGDAITHRYLAVYTIETDDLSAVLEEVRRRAGTAEMILSPTLGEAHTLCFEAIPSSLRADD